MSREQVERFKQPFGRHLHYLNHAVKRMTRPGFVPSDSMYRETFESREAAQALYVTCHYKEC